MGGVTKQVRVFSDYNGWPLWDEEGGTSPGDWPMLSAGLMESLVALEDYWTRNYDHERGWAGRSGAWYDDEARRLVRALQRELGTDYEVVLG
jgi:hypothetical protein